MSSEMLHQCRRVHNLITFNTHAAATRHTMQGAEPQDQTGTSHMQIIKWWVLFDFVAGQPGTAVYGQKRQCSGRCGRVLWMENIYWIMLDKANTDADHEARSWDNECRRWMTQPRTQEAADKTHGFGKLFAAPSPGPPRQLCDPGSGVSA